MRKITKRRLVWVVFVIIISWFLVFAVTRFILPGIMEVPQFGSFQMIRDAVTSSVVLGILTVVVILIIWIIVMDGIVGWKEG